MKILIIDDNGAMLRSTKMALAGNQDVFFEECYSIDEAMKAIAEHTPNVIMLDHELTEGGNEGLEIAKQVKDVTIFSTTGNSEIVAEYIKRGIFHVNKSDMGKFIKTLFEK